MAGTLPELIFIIPGKAEFIHNCVTNAWARGLLASFYRAMHFSAKRGIAIACRLSVRPSVCDVGEL